MVADTDLTPGWRQHGSPAVAGRLSVPGRRASGMKQVSCALLSSDCAPGAAASGLSTHLAHGRGLDYVTIKAWADIGPGAWSRFRFRCRVGHGSAGQADCHTVS